MSREKKMATPFEWKYRQKFLATKDLLKGGIGDKTPVSSLNQVQLENDQDNMSLEELDALPNDVGLTENSKKRLSLMYDSPMLYRASKEDEENKNYYVFKEDKGLFKVDTVENMDKELKQRNVQEMAEESIQTLHKEEDENKMQSEWTERFMGDEFRSMANRYLSDPLFTRQQFQAEVRDRVKSHAQTHSGRASAFDWGEKS